MSDYTENKTPNLIINTLEDPSKLSEITVGENEIVLVPDNTEEEIAKKQDKLVAGTNITLVDDPLTQTTLISSTAQESFFRGRWGNWSLAPSNGNEYPEDYHGNRKPTDNDFMVLSDASDYITPSSLTHPFTVINTHSTAQFTIQFIDEYGAEHTYYYAPYSSDWVQINEYYSLRYVSGAPGYWYIRTNKLEDTHIVVDGIEYEVDPTGTTVQAGVVICKTNSPTTPVVGGLPSQIGQYQGAWRFVYHGAWDTNGKLGWTPQYQIENTLPIATSTEPGIAKLYNTTGQNTDGAVDQATVTSALGEKQDKLTAGTGINIDPNTNIISSTTAESNFRGRFANYTSVPSIAGEYTPDYRGIRTPSNNDYMVVSDASDYTQTTSFVSDGTYLNYNIDGYKGTLKISEIPSTRIHLGEFNQFSIRNGGGRIYGYCNVANTYKTSPSATTYVTTDSACINVDPSSSWSYSFYRDSGSYQGAWRFRYIGMWNTDGKSGWLPEYQVEDVLPIATDQEAGIAKLYTTTGQNTDGSMTQKSITDALGTKQNTLTAGNNITIDANSKIDAADKTLVSFVIWEDDTPTPGE